MIKKMIPLAWKRAFWHAHNRVGRAIEGFTYRAATRRIDQLSPDHECCAFYIVSCQRNAGIFADRCLDSVYTQNYPRNCVRHLFVDDASTDGTTGFVRRWLKRRPDHEVVFTQNLVRRGGTANTLAAFDSAWPGSIVLELNGDDWLPDPGVLAFLNQVYQDPDVWMTYNTPLLGSGEWWALSRPYPKRVVRDNAFREDRWHCGHLHTFRAELHNHVDKAKMVDPLTGELWANADDMAYYWAQLELAGRHAKHIYRPCYVYNIRDQSERNVDPEGVRDRAARIRKVAKHQPLEVLR